MKNLPLLIGTILGTLVLVVVIAIGFSGGGSGSEFEVAELVADARHTRGSEAAPVTITEFSDFECPACAGTAPLIKSVLDKYPDQVKLVYRHFPLNSIHPNAQLAAQASEVAAEEGAFWEFHDYLFANQPEWAEISSDDELISTFESYFDELGIDKTEFSTRINSKELEDKVLADLADANKFGLSSTPSLFVNGEKVTAQQLDTAVQAALNSAE